MRTRNTTYLFFRAISLLMVIVAVALTMFQLVRYSRERNKYPSGMTIAGVPVGGVDAQTASH